MTKKFTICIWDNLNIVFLILSVLFFIPFVVFLVLSFIDTKNGFFIGMSGIFASWFSAFFIAIVVRIVDLQKKKDSEEKALIMLNGYLKEIHSEIGKFFPQTKAFVKINSDHTVSLPKKTIYYTKIDDTMFYSFINFSEEFRLVKYNLDKKIDKCMNSPFFMQCNTEVVNLIAKLQSNKFTQSLQNIPNYQHIEIEPIRYGYIFTEEKDFEILFMELGHLLNIDDVVELRELTEKEKNDYLSFIENVKNTSEICKGSKGKIYYSNKRIV